MRLTCRQWIEVLQRIDQIKYRRLASVIDTAIHLPMKKPLDQPLDVQMTAEQEQFIESLISEETA